MTGIYLWDGIEVSAVLEPSMLPPGRRGTVLYHHRHTPAPDPRAASGLPAAMAELILDLLAKAADDRPANAADVAARLRSIYESAG